MSESDWPREIWMVERYEHDQGVVTAVLSEHATVARFDGDTERERKFHRYVDADILETSEKYYKAKLEEQRAEIERRMRIFGELMNERINNHEAGAGPSACGSLSGELRWFWHEYEARIDTLTSG